jgi:hypothetical protein
VIAATSADADWRLAAAAIVAAAEVPVAAVVLGDGDGDGLPGPRVAGLLHLRAPGELSLGQAGVLIGAVSRAYDVVLVAASAGLPAPVGRDGWTLADLAAEVGAPAVVVTGPGPDAAGHTTQALGALAARGITAAVVTIGDVALPVTPAGRIPADPPADFAGAATWLDPVLHVTADNRPPGPSTRSLSRVPTGRPPRG